MSPHNPNLFPSTHACSHISLFSGSPFCPRTRSTCGGGKKCSRDIDLATRARLLGAPDGVDPRRSPILTHFCSREMTQTEITICDRDHTMRSERVVLSLFVCP